jgi:hypothetical protein
VAGDDDRGSASIVRVVDLHKYFGKLHVHPTALFTRPQNERTRQFLREVLH